MKLVRKSYMLSCVCFLFLLVLAGCSKSSTAAAPELLEPVKMQDQTVLVKRGDISDISVFTAHVQYTYVQVKTELSGVIKNRYVSLGDWVEKGQKLLKMDTQKEEETIEQLKEQIIYEKEYNEKVQRQRNIEERKQQLKLMKLENGEETAYALQKLSISELLIENEYQKKKEELQLEDLEKQLKECQKEIDKSYVYAPVSGKIVYAVNLSNNNNVNRNEIVFLIANTAEKCVVVDDAKAVDFQDAEFVYGVVDDNRYKMEQYPYSEKTIKIANANQIFIPNRLYLPDEIENLGEGEMLPVLVEKNSAKDVLYIPRECINFTENQAYVYRMENGERVQTFITIGMYTKVYAEILTGLEEGQVILAQPSTVLAWEYSLEKAEQKEFYISQSIEHSLIDEASIMKVKSYSEEFVLKNINVEEQSWVEKGDILAEYVGQVKNTDILELEDQLDGLKVSKQKEIKQVRKQIESLDENTGEDINLEIQQKQIEMELIELRYSKEEDALQKQLERKKELLSGISLKAPATGQVHIEKTVINGKESAEFYVTNMENVIIRIFLESHVLHSGEKIKFSRDKTESGRTIEGEVVFSFPDAQLESANVQTDLTTYYSIKGPAEIITAVYSPNVKIVFDKLALKKAVVINKNAVQKDDFGEYVFIQKNGELIKQYVTVGAVSSNAAWIVDGVEAGQEVAVF
ncbi:efflux RND transporter periplasmic adaptor subunit [Anaeromicropila populeti]|uniref:Multidrug efflux pump subunit AcrA (Membrane-fusion protein) n=1 Tax=Anaeromicropila populeti TaxID=37658 RepID=A0A1I6IX76_9FIRM|nr:efflux RND transporter periplasmic adaptor subunit [Anaeromicropila populeti]SFR71342.1 Multidrug efflux pump subunit AcrA (membrane-fusion protein) [Anaeromicropila populeti]